MEEKDTYEILEELSLFGDGAVYLGQNQRTEELVLMEERVGLPDLSGIYLKMNIHEVKLLRYTGLEKIYDYFQEQDHTYRISEYLEGESLKELLKAGRRFSQEAVLRYGKKLLEILDYLHKAEPQGVLHGNVNPSHVIVTTQGDIYLKSLNILMAMGVEGVVDLRDSEGYGSPEHYGYRLDLKKKPVKNRKNSGIQDAVRTRYEMRAVSTLDSGEEFPKKEESFQDFDQLSVFDDLDDLEDFNERMAENERNLQVEVKQFDGYEYTVPGKSEVYMDCRSDLYSVGAILYHMLSGRCPEKEAPLVSPLDKGKYSKALISIIEKAMDPDPDLRFQTANSMKIALEKIEKRDLRARCLSGLSFLAAGFTLVGVSLGGYTAYVGYSALATIDKSVTLANLSGVSLVEGNVSQALAYGLESLASVEELEGKKLGYLNGYVAEEDINRYRAVGQNALTSALGLYEYGYEYQVRGGLNLPSALLGLGITQDGRTGAAMSLGVLTVFSVETGEVLVELPTYESVMTEFFFVDDSLLFYGGASGVTLYDCDSLSAVWSGEPGTNLTMSHNGMFFASILEEESRGYLYHRSGELLREIDFEGYSQLISGDNGEKSSNPLLAVDDHGSYMAVSLAGGRLVLFDCSDSGEDAGGTRVLLEGFEEQALSDYGSITGGFFFNDFVYAWRSGGGSYYSIQDLWTGNERQGETGDFVAQTNGTGIYLYSGSELERRFTLSWEEDLVIETDGAKIVGFDLSDDGSVLVLTADGSILVYDKFGQLMSRIEVDGGTGDFGVIGNTVALTGSYGSSVVTISAVVSGSPDEFVTYDRSLSPVEVRVTQNEDGYVLYNTSGIRAYNLEGERIGASDFTAGREIVRFQYVSEEDQLYVTYTGGTVARYSGTSGSFLGETEGSLYGNEVLELEAGGYRMYHSNGDGVLVYPLGSSELAYCVKSGGSPYDPLYGVKEVGDNFLLEYRTWQGDRYALLCDAEFQILTRIDQYCDYVNGSLYLDLGKGYLLKENLYSLAEIEGMARNWSSFGGSPEINSQEEIEVDSEEETEVEIEEETEVEIDEETEVET